jgi:hypothetical protein
MNQPSSSRQTRPVHLRAPRLDADEIGVLTFPNRSRSLDEARKAVRFVGYDGMFEVPFFVEIAAQAKAGSATLAQTDALAAVDAARIVVQDMARVVYSKGRRTLYVLTAADFR